MISLTRLIRAARHLAFSGALLNSRLLLSVWSVGGLNSPVVIRLSSSVALLNRRPSLSFWSDGGLNSPAVIVVSLLSVVFVLRLGDRKGSRQYSMPESPV